MSEKKPYEIIYLPEAYSWDNQNESPNKFAYILKQTHDKEVAELKEKLRLNEINEAEASCGIKELKTQVNYFSEHAAAFKQDCDRYEEILQGLKNEMASMYSQAAIKLKNEKSRPLSESYIEADTVLNVIDHLHQVLHDLKTQIK